LPSPQRLARIFAPIQGDIGVNCIKFAAVLAFGLLSAAPALAFDLPERGVSREQMVDIMTKHGLPANIKHDDRDNVIVRSRVAGINFDVYFFHCVDGKCREIQFAAGWSNSEATPGMVNEWNTTKRYLRVYWKPNKVIWAEQDAIVGRGTSENIDDYLTTWEDVITEFKRFMKL
jgi:hypothetical protein